jgi:hypothetical protein
VAAGAVVPEEGVVAGRVQAREQGPEVEAAVREAQPALGQAAVQAAHRAERPGQVQALEPPGEEMRNRQVKCHRIKRGENCGTAGPPWLTRGRVQPCRTGALSVH